MKPINASSKIKIGIRKKSKRIFPRKLKKKFIPKIGITSNITKVRIRRDLKVAKNQSAQYELCFGNRFHVEASGRNIKSTGFFVTGESSMVYLTDSPNADGVTGTLAIVKEIDKHKSDPTDRIISGSIECY